MENNNPHASKESVVRNMTYQPFLLAAATIALIVKMVISLTLQSPLLDWILVVILLIFVVATGIYAWEYRKPKRPSEQTVGITTGKVRGSQIIGVDSEGEQPGTESVTINTKDVRESKIFGVKRREG